ncbi:hypothetical protein [Sorangium sp. So ce131]|uniref:hypothetical protein n=1 Tax=Sorangium sp. So ce131 TaxID=3133282 RepID=UPI003F6414BC
MNEKHSVEVGAVVQLGAAFDEVAELLAGVGVGAIPKSKSALSNLLKKVNAAQTKIQAVERRATANPQLRFALPAIKVAKQGTSALAAAMNASTALRVRQTADYLRQPTHVIPVCIDALATATESALITISAPHSGQSWRLVGIGVTNTATGGVSPLRFTSFKMAGVEHVVTSNVAFASGAPTSPGIDISVFNYQNFAHASLPEFRYRPWAMKNGALRSDAKIEFKIYNPHTAGQSGNLSFFVQSNPCGDDSQYSTDRGGFLEFNSTQHKSFLKSLMNGSLFKRVA